MDSTMYAVRFLTRHSIVVVQGVLHTHVMYVGYVTVARGDFTEQLIKAANFRLSPKHLLGCNRIGRTTTCFPRVKGFQNVAGYLLR